MNDKRFSLIDLYFGESTAENEKISLPRYYINTNAYLNAKDKKRKKLFYIGHRGSGKSALFQVLIHEFKKRKNKIIIEIKPYEFSYEAFQKINHNFYDIKSAYSSAWLFTLFIEIFKETVSFFNHNSNIKKNRENVKYIANYLIENNFVLEEDKLNLFIEYLKKASTAKEQLSFDTTKLSEKNSVGSNLANIMKVKNLTGPINALKEITDTYSISIFIDELDSGWNNTKESKHFVAGLIAASRQLDLFDNIDVFLSLRKDMYDNLSEVFYDTEKIRDNIEFIEWTPNRLRSIIIKRLLDNKILRDELNRREDCKDAIDLVFEPDTVDYLLEHTLMRPRELITFCKRLVDKYRDMGTGLTLQKFNISFVKNVEYSFCNDRYKDFCKEYDFEFPGLKKFLDCFEGQKSTYSREEFEEVIIRNIMDVIDNDEEKEWHSIYIDKPIALVRKLFEMGFIKLSFDSDTFFTFYQRGLNNYNNIKTIMINNVFLKALFCDNGNTDDNI